MKWTSALSEQPVLEDAIAECGVAIKSSVGDADLDLAVAFISPHYEDSYDRVADLMAESLGAKHVFGCSGGGVIGNGIRSSSGPVYRSPPQCFQTSISGQPISRWMVCPTWMRAPTNG